MITENKKIGYDVLSLEDIMGLEKICNLKTPGLSAYKMKNRIGGDNAVVLLKKIGFELSHAVITESDLLKMIKSI